MKQKLPKSVAAGVRPGSALAESLSRLDRNLRYKKEALVCSKSLRSMAIDSPHPLAPTDSLVVLGEAELRDALMSLVFQKQA